MKMSSTIDAIDEVKNDLTIQKKLISKHETENAELKELLKKSNEANEFIIRKLNSLEQSALKVLPVSQEPTNTRDSSASSSTSKTNKQSTAKPPSYSRRANQSRTSSLAKTAQKKHEEAHDSSVASDGGIGSNMEMEVDKKESTKN